MSELKKHKYLFASIVSLSLVSLALSILILTDYQGGDIFESNLSFFPAKSTSKSTETVSNLYVNKKGQEWYLPQGNYKFKSSSSRDDIVFLEGEINPVDANVGEMQKFSIIVGSPVGIKNVKVRIERDNSIKELNLVKVKNVSYFDSAKRLIISQAVAQSGDEEQWEGEMLVEDTNNITYRTTFIAEDDLGTTNSFILTWSDPCEIPANGLPLGGSGGTWELEQDCSILSGAVDGIENGDILIDRGNTIFIQGTFVFNPNFQIDIVDGNIVIGTSSGGQIRKTYMWFCDRDGDGRTPDGTIGTIFAQDTAPVSACGGGGGGGGGTFNNLYKRVVNLFNFKTPEAAAELNCGPTGDVWAIRRHLFAEGQIDCYSQSANAYTGATGYCETHRGDGSWDYNCVNGEEKQYQSISSIYCTVQPYPPSTCQKNCVPLSGNYGWSSTIPECGQSGSYSNGCEDTNYEGCIREDEWGGCAGYCSGNYACTESVPSWASQVQRCR